MKKLFRIYNFSCPHYSNNYAFYESHHKDSTVLYVMIKMPHNGGQILCVRALSEMAERNLSAFSELLCLNESHLLIVIPALIH
jgi:hypothetical protein